MINNRLCGYIKLFLAWLKILYDVDKGILFVDLGRFVHFNVKNTV